LGDFGVSDKTAAAASSRAPVASPEFCTQTEYINMKYDTLEYTYFSVSQRVAEWCGRIPEYRKRF